jgi:hypothetical protein
MTAWRARSCVLVPAVAVGEARRETADPTSGANKRFVARVHANCVPHTRSERGRQQFYACANMTAGGRNLQTKPFPPWLHRKFFLARYARARRRGTVDTSAAIGDNRQRCHSSLWRRGVCITTPLTAIYEHHKHPHCTLTWQNVSYLKTAERLSPGKRVQLRARRRCMAIRVDGHDAVRLMMRILQPLAIESAGPAVTAGHSHAARRHRFDNYEPFRGTRQSPYRPSGTRHSAKQR